MNVEELKKEYKRVNDIGDNISEILKLKKMLLSTNEPDILEFHYELLRQRTNIKLYLHVRAAFMDRPAIEGFLIDKSKIEKDEEMQADILQILGTIKSLQAAIMAREYLNHENEYHREVASFVLGWVGNKNDIQILNQHMLNEKSALLRITAASAHRQIAFRMPELKMDIIASLKQGFENEKDDEVIPWIIIMIETILIKRLGIREDKDDPHIWHGDLEKAKKRTAQFLATLDLEKK
jgi:hypothetical protein